MFLCKTCHDLFDCHFHQPTDFGPGASEHQPLTGASFGICEVCENEAGCVDCKAWPKKKTAVPAQDPIPELSPEERDLVIAIEQMTGRTVKVGRHGITFTFRSQHGDFRSRTIESHGRRPERIVAIRDAPREARQDHVPDK